MKCYVQTVGRTEGQSGTNQYAPINFEVGGIKQIFAKDRPHLTSTLPYFYWPIYGYSTCYAIGTPQMTSQQSRSTLFSVALIELAKSSPFTSLILFSHFFFCLPLLLFPSTVPSRIAIALNQVFLRWDQTA